MTDQQILLVKNSWKLFRRIDPELIGDVFYGRLFQQMPLLRPLFKTVTPEKYPDIVEMLSAVISKLNRTDIVTADLTQVALRHVAYNVKPAHYQFAGDALLWTLEKGLGKDWTPETAQAWAACNEILTSIMISAIQ